MYVDGWRTDSLMTMRQISLGRESPLKKKLNASTFAWGHSAKDLHYVDDILSQLAAPWVGMRLTDDNEVDVAGGQVEPRAEGAEDLDPGLRPQREDRAADAVHHGRPDQVLRLRRRHVHVEVFDLLMKPADKYINE